MTANAAFEKAFGPDVEEVVGRNLYDLVVPEEKREKAAEIDRRAIDQGFVDVEVQRRTAEGLRDFQLRVARALDEGGSETYAIYTDITEQKERERDLRLFKEAVEQANDAVLVTEAHPIDEPGPRIEYVNPAFEKMTGYPRGELEGKSPRVLQGPETDRETLDRVREALENGEPWSGETINYRKDGDPYHLRWSIAPVRDEEGEIEHWMSVQRDVTEEREREEQLRRQRNLLEQTQRLAGAWEVDLEADEMSWSDKIYEIHELDPSAELTAEESFKFCAPEARHKVREAFERCAEEGEPYDLEVPIITAEGNRRWVRTVGARAETSGGEVVKVAGAFQDITERKRREERLHTRRQKVEALYEATDQLLRAEGEETVAASIVDLVSQVFDYLVGVRLLDDGQLVPCQLSPKIPEHMPDRPPLDPQGPSVLAEVFRRGETAVFDDVRTAEDPFDYGDVKATVLAPLGQHGIIAVSDLEAGTIGDFDRRLIEILSTYATLVLDRIERERQLLEAKEDAEEASRLKSAMLANMSHETRTPLTSITGFSEMLKENLTGKLEVFAAKIHDGSQRLQRTLDSVLHLSKLEAGAYELDREDVALQDVTREVVETLGQPAEEKSITITTDTPTSSVLGHWNEDALFRICRNLLGNAIKFTPEGGHVDVRIGEDNHHGVLEIEDDGIGMEPENVPELFKAFKQESEGLDREYEGSGLGLSIVQRLTEALDGSIDVETEKGEGTCFTVRLPLT